MDNRILFEPTVWGAVHRYWYVVLAFVLTVGSLAFLFASLFSTDWQARSSVLVEDPATSRLFDTGVLGRPERFVADQVAILQSPAFIEEVIREAEMGGRVTSQSLEASTSIRAQTDSNLISISVRADDGDQAIAIANAYLTVYESTREVFASARFERAINELDRSISDANSELSDIELSIASLTETHRGDELDEKLDQLIDELIDGDALESAEIAQIVGQLEAIQIARGIPSQDSRMLFLLEQRNDAIERRSQLVTRRDQLVVDASLTLSGVVRSSEASIATPATNRLRMTMAGALLGLVLGGGVAFVAALRNRRFATRFEPEVVLSAPMLAEVPTWDSKPSGSRLPILSDPTSPQAEAFRFASEAIAVQLRKLGPEGGRGVGGRGVIVFTSALVDDGKTTLIANTALATATQGKSVLLIDADFGDPSLTRLLADGQLPQFGLTDIVQHEISLAGSVIKIDTGTGVEIDLLARGSGPLAAPDFFRMRATAELLEFVKSTYDFVFVDSPPLLQISYATSVVALCNAAVVVVPHNGPVSLYEDLARSLSLITTPALGYIYNRAPLRPEMTERSGSTLDPLGTARGTVGVTSRQP